jgi:molybdate transport system substrate-binding protein
VRTGAVLGAAALLAVTACGGASSGGSANQDGDGLSGTLTVFAAASLTDVFEDLGARLTGEHPDLEVRFSFAGSSALAQQVVQGAPADVFASADERQMAVVTAEGLTASEPEVFATNVLRIAVPAGNPADVTGLADFARDDLALALCAPQVPCGRAAGDLFEAAGVVPVPDTYEEDVRAALTKVELGEVDAALVYASDVVAAGDAVEGVAVPEAEDVVNRYPVVALAGAGNPEAARAFVDLVLSDAGQQVLRDAGFQRP